MSHEQKKKVLPLEELFIFDVFDLQIDGVDISQEEYEGMLAFVRSLRRIKESTSPKKSHVTTGKT